MFQLPSNIFSALRRALPFTRPAPASLVLTGFLLSGCQTLSHHPAIHAETSEPVILSTRTIATDAETGWAILSKQPVNNTDQKANPPSPYSSTLQWLVLDSDRGPLLDGKPLSDTTRTLEYGDQRGSVFLSYEPDEKRLWLFSLDEEHLTETQSSEPLEFALEGLCLYQPAGEPLQAFLLGEDQLARQVILQRSGKALTLLPLRTLPLPPGTEYCATSDATAELYISEEGVGVWALPASAEKELVRSAVDLITPWGQLTNGSGPLAIAGDQLLVAGVGSNTVSAYAIDTPSSYSATGYWSLPENAEIETLTAISDGNGQVYLTLFDESRGQLLTTELPLMVRQLVSNPIPTVAAVAETTPVATAGDAADDPAIWVNHRSPEHSLILGTNKKQGLGVYRLDGQQQQFLAAGRVNNVDLRQGITLRGQAMDIAAASQRDRQAISLFAIHPESGQVKMVTDIPTHLDDVYGLCMYLADNDQPYVFINDEDGRFEQYRIDDSADGWSGTLVRAFAVDTQPEGCVADDLTDTLFLGEENRAVWKIPASPDSPSAPELILPVSDRLVADIEGLGLYRTREKSYLVVSSQGNDTYLVFDTEAPYREVGRFRVGMNPTAGIDGASETDGLEVTSFNLGARYPEGLLVVQDGRNVMPAEHQNFKLVDWSDISGLLLP